MTDYSDLLSGNPYFAQPSEDQKRASNVGSLGQLLLGLGAGISSQGGTGQPWFNGVAPGLNMGMNTITKQKEQDDLEQARRFQMGLHLQQLKQLQDDRDLKNKGIAALVAANGGGPTPDANPSAVPGLNVQPNPVQLGPRAAPSPTGPPGAAISKIEGDYSSIGPVADAKGSRGYGKYQVMDYNVGPWTKEALGQEMTPQQFLQNPQAQDTVFNNKFGQYQKKYGPVGAAKAWFAGEKGMNNPNATDVNGMSVRRYGDTFAANGGAAAAPGGAGPTFASLPPFEGAGMPDPAMQSGALPPGVEPKLNLPPALAAPSASPVLPPFQIPGMPTGPTPPAAPSSPLQPAIAQGGSDASPVPQPIQSAQFTPPPALLAPGAPPKVPRPTQLPPAEANVLNNLLMTRAITPEQFLAQKNKRLDEIHHDDQTAATEAWKQQNENYRFNRGEANKQDRWEMIQPQDAQAMGLPPNVQFQRNKSGEIKPVRDTKEVDKDISPLYAAPEVQSIVDRLSPVDRAAFNAATKLGDHKGAATILTKGQTGLTEEQQKLTGQALLDTLPFGDKENVTGLVEGRIKPSDLSKRSGNGTDINRYIALAQRVDPSYTPNDAGARNAFETKYMVNGLGGQQLQAANTVMPHLETWLRLQTALANGDSQTVNSILNAAKKQFGDAKVTSAEAASELYGTEVARAIRGGGPLNEKEELAAKAMTNASKLSPDQAKGIASTLTEMMMGRVHVLQETAVHMHGVSQEKANNYMLPSSREALERIQKGDFSGGKGAPEPNKMRPPLERFQR